MSDWAVGRYWQPCTTLFSTRNYSCILACLIICWYSLLSLTTCPYIYIYIYTQTHTHLKLSAPNFFLSSICMCAHFHISHFLYLGVLTFVSLIACATCFDGSSFSVLETQTCTYTLCSFLSFFLRNIVLQQASL